MSEEIRFEVVISISEDHKMGIAADEKIAYEDLQIIDIQMWFIKKMVDGLKDIDERFA